MFDEAYEYLEKKLDKLTFSRLKKPNKTNIMVDKE